MPTAESSSHCSTVVLMSKGLTPGKLRGLQRISNPNGTLTMVALDQNSSMIEMAAKALKAKGQDREPHIRAKSSRPRLTWRRTWHLQPRAC